MPSLGAVLIRHEQTTAISLTPKKWLLGSMALLVQCLVSVSLVSMMCSASVAKTSQSDLARKPAVATPNSPFESGWLGLTVQDLTPELAQALGLGETHGVLVARIEPDSPAARAGLERRDTIVGINGRLVQNTSTLVDMLAGAEPGTIVQVDILRAGNKRTLQVTIDRTMSAARETIAHLSPDEIEALLGIAVQQDQRGVVLTYVSSDDPAALAGLKTGDIIHEINQTAITTLASYHMALASLSLEKPALLLLSFPFGPLD